ncbi:male sterility protein [Xylariaceae sp. FL0255]|nr:male sterility protein [Xylariaceae sp. FL0255]
MATNTNTIPSVSWKTAKEPIDLSAKTQAPAAVPHVVVGDSSLLTIDELLRSRAVSHPDLPIVSYPSSGLEYVDYTFKQLDVFAFRVAKHLEAHLPIRTSSSIKRDVVAMLGPSNLEYLVTMMALIKAGHTVLFLSTRIPAVAVESLMKTTDAHCLIADARYLETAAAVQKVQPALKVLDMPARVAFEFPIDVYNDTKLDAALDPQVETKETVYIIHSSGSTGLPKPIYQEQSAALSNYAGNMNMKAFITLPLYHNHGISNLYRSIWACKSIHLFNADLPLTSDLLIKVMRAIKFEILYGVPYVLKLISETEEGLELLAEMKNVMYGGSACPDELGDLLVQHGVNLISHYGATEVGGLMTSFRPPGDKAWNYVREHDKLAPYLRWLPRGANLYECCVAPGWPSKTATNMEDGSYRTKDLFEPHPTIPKAWRYVARQDDTIVLVNGEKFNPVATEGAFRSSKLITEAVIFGVGQPCLGALIVPAPSFSGKSSSEILDMIWPVLDAGQEGVDAFARLSKEMVVILPSDTPYPHTDKGSIIRPTFYKTFVKQIDSAYQFLNGSSADARVMGEDELRQLLRDLVLKSLPDARFDDDTDFFGLGLDSLKSIQIRADVLKSVKVNNKLTQNVVFENPSISKLSAYLLGNPNDQNDGESDLRSEMRKLVNDYSDFTIKPREPGKFVVVTGSTGSLGAHIVAKLAQDPTVERIYCFVRAHDAGNALRRTIESMVSRKLYHSLSLLQRRKIVSLCSDFSRKDLGLEAAAYREISSSLRAVIHSAWSVNFNLKLSSFVRDNVAGVKNLIEFCKSGTASFNFCSSVSTVARYPDLKGPVPEVEPDFEWAQDMGYAQSKSVAEAICARAAESAGIPVRVLRIGQVVADTEHGIWNATEGVPMIMQTALTVGALPKLHESPSWLPVDVVAQSAVEISLSGNESTFMNITNDRTFSWVDDLLPALRNAGLSFEEVEPKEWIRRLRNSDPNPITNPPIKLVDFFAGKYDKDEFAPSKQYATETARSFSPALANAPVLDQKFVDKFVNRFLSNAWKAKMPTPIEDAEPQNKTVLVVAGPCGCGKSTLATGLARELGVPFVEGDSLHSKAAVDSMRAGIALADEDRQPWFARINKRIEEELYDLGYPKVVVSCSSLKRDYRDILRQAGQERVVKPDFVFLNLQCNPETLESRLQGRGGHYMKAEMVRSQVDIEEAVWNDETDVYPIDAERHPDEVLDEAKWCLEHM